MSIVNFTVIGLYRSGDASISYPWDDMTMRMANYRVADSEASL